MDEDETKNYCNTAFIFDVDNFNSSLAKIGLELTDMRLFINYFLEDDDLLAGMENMEGRFFNSVVYIVSTMVNEEKRTKQNKFLNDLGRENGDFIKIVVVDPKRTRRGELNSCTDSEISSFMAMALYDKSVDKIVLVSGDGDFLRPLKRIGVVGKKIYQIGVKGSVSRNLTSHIGLLGGKVFTIKENLPGLSKIDSRRSKKKKSKPKKSRDNRKWNRYNKHNEWNEWNKK